jgi:hypothetical protein
MSLVAFPKSKPSKTLLRDILQLDYLLYESKKDKFTDVWAFINLLPVDKTNPYPWCKIPTVYAKGVGIAIFRYEMLKIVASDTVSRGGNLRHITCAQLHLGYMDKVLSRFFKAAKAKGDNIDVTWRDNSFDEWIRTEFHVRKHTPDDIATWQLLYPETNLSRGPIDALGMILSLFFVYTCPSLYVLIRMGFV